MKISRAAVRHLGVDHGVTLLNTHGDDAPGSRIAERGQFRLLDDAVAGPHDDELVGLELLDGQKRRDAFAFLHRHEVRNGLAAPVGTNVRNLVDLEPVHSAPIREDQNVRMRRRHEEVADEVLFPRPHPDAALSTPTLVPIVRDGRALDVAGIAHRDRHVLFGDQILDAELTLFGQNLRPPIVPVLLAHGTKLVHDDLHHELLAREDRQQAFDQREQFRQLVQDLLPLEAGQPLQLHVEDGLGLNLAQAELRHQSIPGRPRIGRAADERNHSIEVIEGGPEPLEQVPPGLRLPQLELGAPADDLSPELHKGVDQLDERQHLRPAADNGQHDDAEAALQRRVLVEVVEDDVADFASLQIDDDAQAVAIGLVANVRDALERFLPDEVRDALDEPRLVDLVRESRRSRSTSGRPSSRPRSRPSRASRQRRGR